MFKDVRKVCLNIFIETKEEFLIYTSLLYYEKVFSSATHDSVMEFMSLLNFLVRKGVKVKVLVGGITEEMLESGELKSLLPLIAMAPTIDNTNIDTKYTDLITNNFEIIDGEKVLLKILNPIDLKENFAIIYVWRKEFAQNFRKKFNTMWETATDFSISFKSKNWTTYELINKAY